ncbi:cellulose synthase complex periplasmic endoglucanase BcsZ [Stenotrophomonas sp.]|uniref:cellulose synthase complex periplasmic endoglucanase BcsZ n=1 Tax=Stenotrophomonas sp. TaxID=69392 RepID=UPI0028AA4901|nr:cellulose synthase complex periplasmic endoglucanase BcsZ [Stenotrophomonas sp.]
MRHTSDPAPAPPRRRFLQALAAAGVAAALPLDALAQACGTPWREWRAFVDRHIEADGRVVDHLNTDLRSTSESQSYGLFFALVDNDPILFDRILAWTRRHLCRGRADLNLPAWLWGRAADGQFRVLDNNTASDGEVWIAYALLEAGRLWKRPGLVEAGRQTLALMRTAEVVELPGFGPMLLPGNRGFVQADRWTLNPSYLPLFVLRRFAAVDARGPWARLAERSVAMVRASAPVGFAPDWIAWNGKAFVVDPAKGATGSYDAIRCYLWAGMTDPADPLRRTLLDGLSGPVSLLRAQAGFAEKIETRRGVGTGAPSPGFAAALLPYLSALGQPALAKVQLARIPAAGTLNYYDRALVLFGKGWMDRRYRFSADGRLLPAWSSPCSARP